MEDNSTLATDQSAADKPLVSVIIPAYNAEAFILHTLNSVLSQTYKNIEVIVVDDGSNDGTAQIVETIMQRDDRVTLLRQSNCGVAAARNLAIKKSRGEYIAPIDADDIWYPQKIEKQVHCMLHAGPGTGLVYGWTVQIDKRGMLTGGYNAFDIEGNVFMEFMFTNFIGNGSAALIRRVCFDQVGGYNTQMEPCEDYDLQLRIAAFFKFRVVKGFHVGYRKVVGSMSHNYRAMEKARCIVVEGVKQKHTDIPTFVYRWSWSHYLLYLSRQSMHCGHYWTSTLYLYKAAWRSPVFLLHKEFHLCVCVRIWQLVKKLAIFTTSLVMQCPSAGIFKIANPKREKDTISDIVIRSSRSPIGLNRLHRIRLRHIQRLLVEWKTERAHSTLKCNTWESRKENAILSVYGKTIQTTNNN